MTMFFETHTVTMFPAGFRIRHILTADPDLLDTDPHENALKFKMSRQESL